MVRTASVDSPVRVGLVGTGTFGQLVGEQFYRNDDCVVAGIADVNKRNRRNAADEFDVPASACYEDYEDLLAEADLDAVFIATPHAYHYEHVLAGLDSDLHVLCEKPLCLDADEADELVDRVEESDRVFMLGYQRHLETAYREAREYWANGADEPVFITAEVTQDWLTGVSGTWRTDPELSGGGQLIDTGSHLLDAVLWITGLSPTSVAADMVYADDEDRVDVQASLTVRFENDAVASIAVSGDTPSVSEDIRVWGDEGATVIEGRGWNPRTYKEIDDEGTIQDPNIGLGETQSKADAFVEAILDGEDPPATVYDGYRTTVLTDAAYAAAKSGERVEFDVDVEP